MNVLTSITVLGFLIFFHEMGHFLAAIFQGIYVNGFSTSLPEDIQDKAIRAIDGFENVKFLRYGYAIEYDYFPPTQLKHNLETKLVSNLMRGKWQDAVAELVNIHRLEMKISSKKCKFDAKFIFLQLETFVLATFLHPEFSF